ncbi:hypothetical protein C8R43DRAFT_1112177 [Mycena crocata]|nr:hypothetical protein C8R43DRAFT_1112177 [Mycena crocata]
MLCDACKHPLLPPDVLPTPTQIHDLREFLSSGALPLDPSQYHSQIATSTAVLAQCDIQIKGLQETLGILLADRLKLQDHVDGLRAAMSPVRSLPSEILGEIFVSFSQSQRSGNVEEELDRLAKSDLLEVSKVCSRWHRVPLGTPRLWSDIAVNLDLWADELSEDNSHLNLLTTSLERGGNHPLTLSLTLENPLEREHAVSALTVLEQHSQRWQHMYYCGPSSGLDHISQIKGKLDILETLSLQSWQREEEAVADLLEIAPRLTKVSLELGNIQFCLKLPWNQLRSFTCVGANSEEISYVTALMRNITHSEAAVELRRFNGFESHRDLPTVTCSISSFLVEMGRSYHPAYDSGLGEIFACLTCGNFLEIPGVAITEDELLRSVRSLGSLERLVISDHLRFRDFLDHILITDTLLLHLTRTADSQLIPRLTHLTCRSLFKFSADVYFDFVVSRVAPGEEPFQCGLRYFAGTPPQYDPNTHRKLLELVEKGELEFSIEEEGVLVRVGNEQKVQGWLGWLHRQARPAQLRALLLPNSKILPEKHPENDAHHKKLAASVWWSRGSNAHDPLTTCLTTIQRKDRYWLRLRDLGTWLRRFSSLNPEIVVANQSILTRLWGPVYALFNTVDQLDFPSSTTHGGSNGPTVKNPGRPQRRSQNWFPVCSQLIE